MPSKFDILYIKKQIESAGYLLLEDNYVNTLSPLNMQCEKGHVFPMSFKVFSKGHRCSYCAGKRQYNIEEVKEFFKQSGYTLLSKTYDNNKEKLQVLGPDGSQYETTLFAFKVQGIIPHLKGKVFKTEELCRDAMESITGEKFPKSKPSWMLNEATGRIFELDGYSEELKMAFEYDGQHHFDGCNYNSEDVGVIKNRDLLKNDLCVKNGVRLIRIPFYIENKYQFIHNEINNFNKALFVGDPHVQPKNIEECEDLFKFIKNTATKKNCNTVVLMGDLFHTHGVIRVEVLDFWTRQLKILSKQFKIRVLVGNHDMILGEGYYAGISPLDVFKEDYKYTFSIVNIPMIIENIAYIPYMSDHVTFIKAAQDLYDQGATKLLVAHQTFTGATYENGFYAEDGIDPALVPQDAIISGHIHKQQQIGKCFYPGTPKWDTMSDANEDKGIWIFDHNEDGSVKSKEFISTKGVVTSIVKHTMNEGDEEVVLDEKARNYIELVGSTAWITQMKKKYKGLAAIKARPSDKKHVNISKDKMFSITDYLDTAFKPIDGVSKEDIKNYLKEVTNG